MSNEVSKDYFEYGASLPATLKKIPSPDKSALQKAFSTSGDGESVKSEGRIFTAITVTRQQFPPNFSRAMTALGRELNSVVRQFVSILYQISCQPVRKYFHFKLRCEQSGKLGSSSNEFFYVQP